MTSLDVSPAGIKDEAGSDTGVCCSSVQDGFFASPRTPGAHQSTPALTPSSEYSEADLLTPSTPKEFEYSPLDTPTKAPKRSHFAQTCIPLKIQLRSSEDDHNEDVPKVLWDISLDSVLGSYRLFDYEPPSVSSKEELEMAPSLSFTANDFCFSSKRVHKLCQRSRAGGRITQEATPTQSQRAPAVNISTSPVGSPNLTEKPTPSKSMKPLEDVLTRLLPRDVLVRLTDDIGRCVAETMSKPTHRCQNRLSKQTLRATAVIEILRAIDDIDTGTFTTLFHKVSQILPEVLCTKGKHLKIAMKSLHDMESRLIEAVNDERVRLESEVKAWLRKLVDERSSEMRSSAQHRSTDAEKPSVGDPTNAVRRSASLQAAESSHSSYNELEGTSYRLYYAIGSPEATLSVSKLIQRKLERPLLKSETKQGFLYVFWRRGNFGLIKIGYTTCTTDKRLGQWQRQCGGEIEDCHTEDHSSQVRVRNVRRLESLVHAELKDYRKLQLNCRGCHKSHREWFDVDIALAHKVVDKWTNWFSEGERYEDRTRGKLLAMDDAELARLCTPTRLEAPPSLAVPAFGRRRSSGHARTRSTSGLPLLDNPWAALAGRKHSWATDTLLS